jgi:penicillin-binding protein 1C
MRPLRRATSVQVPAIIAAKAQATKSSEIRSTIDGHIQKALDLISKRQSVSAVVLDNGTGDVIAGLGDQPLAPHRAGGILSPLIYALALDRRQITLASKLRDSPLWNSSNREFHEVVSARSALSFGLAIPTVAALETVGVDQFIDLLKDMGFENLGSSRKYGSAVGLGDLDVQLADVTNAYRTLANAGRFSPWRWELTNAPADSRHVISEEATYLVDDVLAHDGNMADQWVVYRTADGTSNSHWCVGFSNRWTVGVYADNESASEALGVWRDMMHKLHAYDHSLPPIMPAQIVKKVVPVDTKQSTLELFISGTEPRTRQRHRSPATEESHIIFPVDLSTVTFDPRVPKTTARIFFQVHPENQNLQWVLNGRVIGKAREFLSWPAQEGEYQLNLQDGNGKIVDQVRFNVKAATVSDTKMVGRRDY